MRRATGSGVKPKGSHRVPYVLYEWCKSWAIVDVTDQRHAAPSDAWMDVKHVTSEDADLGLL